MIFLLEYDRHAGKLVGITTYPANMRVAASSDRLELEIRLLTEGVTREVVLLEADSEEDLRKTHNRYFKGVVDLAKSVRQTVRLPDTPSQSGDEE